MSLTWMSSKLNVRHLYYNNKNELSGADTHCPNLGTSHFFSWFLLGKKVLKSQGLGEGGQRAQTSSYKISQLWGCNVHSGDYN